MVLSRWWKLSTYCAVHTYADMLGRRGGPTFLQKYFPMCPICLKILVFHKSRSFIWLYPLCCKWSDHLFMFFFSQANRFQAVLLFSLKGMVAPDLGSILAYIKRSGLEFVNPLVFKFFCCSFDLHSLFQFMKRFIVKHLGDLWNLQDGFKIFEAVLQFSMIPNWRNACKSQR